jgi:predicted Rdx family selenoprotein
LDGWVDGISIWEKKREGGDPQELVPKFA